MQVSLSDPHSILAWWRTWPERHSIELQVMSQWYPQFATPIRQAWALISAELAASQQAA